jgi:hypothetical protein
MALDVNDIRKWFSSILQGGNHWLLLLVELVINWF